MRGGRDNIRVAPAGVRSRPFVAAVSLLLAGCGRSSTSTSRAGPAAHSCAEAESRALRSNVQRTHLTSEPRTPSPPIGAVRWDAWSNDSSLPWWTNAGLRKTIPEGTKFHHRQPSLWSDFQLWNTECSIDTQSIVDAEIAAAAGKLDFWFYDLFGIASVLEGTGDEAAQSNINRGFDAHFASVYKADVKFAFILQYKWMVHPDFSGKYFQEFCDWIAVKIQDPSYMRVDGKPLVGLYNDRGGGGWEGNPDRWTTLKRTVGEAVYGLSVNSVSMLQQLGLQANMTYEYNGVGLSGDGQHSYAELMDADAGRDGSVPGADRISSRTQTMDRRPMAADETKTLWTDQPTQPQWTETLRRGMAETQKLMIIATWDEISEAGPGIVPTFQEGTRYLDAIEWLRTGQFPSSYSFKWSANWLSCASNGMWTAFFPDPAGVQGAHDGDQLISANAGDWRAIWMNTMSSCEIYAETGPDSGKVDLFADASFVTTVDLYAPSQIVSTKIATLTFSGMGPHSCQVVVNGGKNTESSSAQVKLDYFMPTYAPEMEGLPVPLPPDQ